MPNLVVLPSKCANSMSAYLKNMTTKVKGNKIINCLGSRSLCNPASSKLRTQNILIDANMSGRSDSIPGVDNIPVRNLIRLTRGEQRLRWYNWWGEVIKLRRLNNGWSGEVRVCSFRVTKPGHATIISQLLSSR